MEEEKQNLSELMFVAKS